MDKEEILAKSRAENNDRDFVEVEALDRANSISLNAGVLLCSLIIGACIWIFDFGAVSLVQFILKMFGA